MCSVDSWSCLAPCLSLLFFLHSALSLSASVSWVLLSSEYITSFHCRLTALSLFPPDWRRMSGITPTPAWKVAVTCWSISTPLATVSGSQLAASCSKDPPSLPELCPHDVSAECGQYELQGHTNMSVLSGFFRIHTWIRPSFCVLLCSWNAFPEPSGFETIQRWQICMYMWDIVCQPSQLKLSFHTNWALSSHHTHPRLHPSTSLSTENPAVSSPLRCTVILILLSPRQSVFIHCPFRLHSFMGEYICSCPPQVGLHINHNLILHRQPCCLPNSPEDGGADRVGGRPGRSDGHRVRHHARRLHHDLLPGQMLHTSLHMMDCLYC